MAVSHRLQVRRTARYFTRGADRADVREVWFVLHGYGQLAERFIASFGEVDDGSRLIVAPEALNRFYLVPPRSAPPAERPVGATWMTREDRETEIVDYLAYLDAVYLEVMDGGRLPERGERARDESTEPPAGVRTVVVGFSQGAATAARWVAASSRRFDSLVLWGGLLPPELDLAAFARQQESAPLTIVVGTADDYISPAALEEQQASLQRHGVRCAVQRFTGGHAIDRAALRTLAASFTWTDAPCR